jgi:hypothetical protein
MSDEVCVKVTTNSFFINCEKLQKQTTRQLFDCIIKITLHFEDSEMIDRNSENLTKTQLMATLQP